MWVWYVYWQVDEEYWYDVKPMPLPWPEAVSESCMMIPGTYTQMREDYD